MALPLTITGISTAIATVGPFKGANPGAGPTVNSSTLQFGANVGGGANAYAESALTPGSAFICSGINCNIAKLGAPVDGIIAELWSGLHRTGILLASSGAVQVPSTTATNVYFPFSSSVSIASGTVYYIVMKRAGSADGSNNYVVTTSVSAPDTVYRYAGDAIGTTNNTSGSLLTAQLMKDAFYFFGLNSTTNSRIDAMKATDPTSSWSSVANTTFNSSGQKQWLSGYQAGNVIHLITVDGIAGTQQHKYQQFNMATDAFLAVASSEQVTSALTTAGATGSPQYACSIVVRSTGEVVAFFNGAQSKTSGTFYARVYYSRRTAVNTWSAAVEVDAVGAYDARNAKAVLGISDTVHFLWYNGNPNNTIPQRTLSAANALQTASAGTSFATPIILGSDVYLNAATVKVVCAYSNRALYFDSSVTPTVSNSLVDGSAMSPSRMFHDGTTAYVVYALNTDSCLYVRSSTTDGATWSASTKIFTGTVVGVDVNLSLDGDIYQRGNSVVIPYIVNDNGTLKYSECLLRYANPLVLQPTRSNAAAVMGSGSGNNIYTEQQSQGFTVPAGKNWTIQGVLLQLATTSNAPIDTLSLAIRQGAPDGALIATSSTVFTAASVGNTGLGALREFAFASVSLNPGLYYFVATRSGAFVSNQSFNIGYGGAADPYTGGVMYAYHTIDGWTTASYDGCDWVMQIGGIETVSTGPLNYTLSCTVGAFTLTGYNATLARSYDFNVDTGSFAMTGNAVNFVHGYKMTVSPATFTLAGTAPVLRASRKMATTAGSFVLAGAAPTLRAARKFAVTPGAFTLTGQSAALRAARIMSAQPTSSFTLTGIDVNFVRGGGAPIAYVMTVSPATFTMSGFSSTLRVGRRLVAAPGAFTLAGTAPVLRAARRMVTAAASFTLAGTSPILRVGRRMVTTTASFTLTGASIILRFGRRVVAQTGSFLLAGTAPVLRVARRLVATTGAFTLTGYAANLVYRVTGGYRMLATTGAFVLSGSAARLAAARRLAASTGSFAFSWKPIGWIFGRGMKVSPASFVLTGYDAKLYIITNYKMKTETAIFAMTGYSADLWRSGTEQPGPMNFGIKQVVIPGRW